MNKLLISLISVLCTGSFALAADASIKDQTITCSRDNTESARALAKYWQLHPASRKGTTATPPMQMEDAAEFKIVIKDGKLSEVTIDQAFDNGYWTLANANEGDKAYYKIGQPTQAKNGNISLELSYDGYDHFNYDLSISPTKRSAVIKSSGEIDCGDGRHNFLAVYSCDVR